MMGKLEKLRSRFFVRKERPSSSKLPTDLSINSTSINASAEDEAHGCIVQRIGGHLYWNEARRIYSDPTSTRTSIDGAGSGKTNGNARRSREECGLEAEDWLGTDVTDDDVFLDLEEDESELGVTSTALESYGEFTTLQRTHGWTWPATLSLSEDALTAWDDWRIAPHELDIDLMVSCTNRETIYSGYWHGKVCVHTRSASAVQDVVCFLKEVQTLSCIRHQNIQLFMGASVSVTTQEPLLLIMSELKGLSLHTRLHSSGHVFTHRSKLIILHQIAEGMEYLHAKKIPHNLLTTTHISLHTCRVCVSLPPQRSDSQIFYAIELTYLPPEYIRSLSVVTALSNSICDVKPSTGMQGQRSLQLNRPRSVCGSVNGRLLSVGLGRRCTSITGMFAADIFAFGTIAYELGTLKHPFQHLPLECLILSVGREECQTLHLVTSRMLTTLIGDCWSACPHSRPTFKHLVQSLEQSMKEIPTTTTTRGMKRSASLPSLQAAVGPCSSLN